MRGYCKGCFFWKEGKVEGGTNCIAPKSHKDIYHPFRDVDCYVEKGMILVEEEVSNGTAFGEIEDEDCFRPVGFIWTGSEEEVCETSECESWKARGLLEVLQKVWMTFVGLGKF